MADLKLLIDGDEYDVPMLASLSIAESMVFYEYAKVSPLEMEDLTPGALAAMLHIALRRGKPGLRERQIREMVGELNMQDLFLQLAEKFEAASEEEEQEEDEERPPTSPTTTGAEPSKDVVGNETASLPSDERPSNGSSDHSPDLHDLSPTGAPV